ncbi:hypothetical protein [Pontibaca methylaminivorans]|uniref:Cysteine rich repeat-containing protein n=1 Tax=Pontibaca methylaminivorans TaxID=515897 RepID=A0A1R3X9N3_9RHOB|nr:hypothetical protein [Pontibaca methylaminivorans]SIT86990.1 hypothetical protein SAMN05421849_2489 [Pontibaca methylaminivorans]
MSAFPNFSTKASKVRVVSTVILFFCAASTIQAQEITLTERAAEAYQLCSTNSHLDGLDCNCIAQGFMAFDAKQPENSVVNIFDEFMRTDITECVVPEKIRAKAVGRCMEAVPYGRVPNSRNLSEEELCSCIGDEALKEALAGNPVGAGLSSAAILACGT